MNYKVTEAGQRRQEKSKQRAQQKIEKWRQLIGLVTAAAVLATSRPAGGGLIVERKPIELTLTSEVLPTGQLKQLIEESGMTRYEVPAHAEISQSIMSMIYNCRRITTLETQRTVAHGIGRKVTIRIN